MNSGEGMQMMNSQSKQRINKNSDYNETLQYVVRYLTNQYSVLQMNKKDQEERHLLDEIDVCLDDICRMDFVRSFSGIQRLMLLNQGIQMIEGLQECKVLEELYLNENMVTTMKGVEHCPSLKRIYLSNNRIKKIEGLDNAHNLEILWLDENHIEVLQGLSKLTKVVELNLACNKIESIRSGLDGMDKLYSLNLSANKLGNFKELLNINRLQGLKTATFFDPHYGENPICNLCNYQTYVLYHLPNLVKLDTLQISEEAKAFAEGTFMKKRMYYNMRIKTIQRVTSNILKVLKIGYQIRRFKIDIDVTKLTKRLNYVVRELEERKILPKELTADIQSIIKYGEEQEDSNPLDLYDQGRLASDLDLKQAFIQGKINDKNEDLRDLEVIYESLRRKVYQLSEQNIQRMMIELETGGNIRYEEGKSSDKWYSSCVDLLRSRFNQEQFREFGIVGLNVTRVTRIHNRFIRNRFEERLEQLVDLTDNSYKKSLEYLFYGTDPKSPTEIQRAMEEGFRNGQEYEQMGMPPCVSLVNSVASADISRIKHYLNNEDGHAHIRTASKRKGSVRMTDNSAVESGLVQIPSGHILVCKVYLSKCSQDLKYPNFNYQSAPSAIWESFPPELNQDNSQSVYRVKENEAKQRMWFIFDNALVLPEYMVEFEYNYNTADDSPKKKTAKEVNEDCNKLFSLVKGVQNVLDDTYIRHLKRTSMSANFYITYQDLDRSDLGSFKNTISQFLKSCHIEELVENQMRFLDDESKITKEMENRFPPTIPIRSKLEQIELYGIQCASKSAQVDTIIYLNLFNNKICKIDGLQNLVNLQILILSFNEIKKIENIQFCGKLKRLDLNHNFIQKIEAIEGLCDLKILDLGNNWVSDFNQISNLSLKQQAINEINLKCNPVASKKSYRSEVFRLLPSLLKLDGISISEKDREQLLQDTNTITPELLQQFEVKRVNGDLKKDMMDNWWQKGVEILALNHLKIAQISNLTDFKNVRRLALIDNQISKIEGLTKMPLLEEISFEKNKITKIEGLTQQKFLKKLDLGRNRITMIEGLDHLENLTQLSLEDNEVKSLTGLSLLFNLMELYIGNNLIEELKEIQNLKSLPKLIILDISGNILCKEKHFRIYTIFHIRNLKVLDGISIESAEKQEAKESFAGRLTEEILDSRLKGKQLKEVRELDLSQCKLRDFEDMFDESLMPHLRELNLSNNYFTTLRGFGYCPKLRILQVSNNRLETVFCKPTDDGYPRGLLGMPGLEVLDVSYNQLTDLYGLQFAPLKELKILNASNNEIIKVEFIECLRQLRELDLSKNKIRQFDTQVIQFSNSFQTFHILTCLKIEDNGLRTLQNIDKLTKLQALFLSGNRIAEFWEIDKLCEMEHLMELQILQTPLAKKPAYRSAVIKRIPQLLVLDGKEVTMEERDRVDQNLGMEQRPQPMVHYSNYSQQKVQVKLNSVNFDGVFNNLKMFQEQPTPQNPAGESLDMNNLMQVQSIVNTEKPASSGRPGSKNQKSEKVFAGQNKPPSAQQQMIGNVYNSGGIGGTRPPMGSNGHKKVTKGKK